MENRAPDSSSPADYELLSVLGRGGMGIVYRARQVSLDRIVALKMLRPDSGAEPLLVERFRAEAGVVAQLQHPHIVAIHEVGESHGQPYFTMEYVEGTDLGRILSEAGSKGVEIGRAARWLRSAAEATQHAHEHGIIHRDLKPSNILIDISDQPRLTDFGLAKRLAADSDLTLTGQVLGSPGYLSPEQAVGRAAGVTSDVYSLGAILYHLLTGRPPFQGETLTEVLRQVAETDPVAPGLLRPGVPRDLASVCLRALEKDPGRRYATCRELAEDLGRFMEGQPTRARPVGPGGRLARWCRRQPVRAGLSLALLLTVLLGVVGISRQWRRAEREKESARRHAYAGDIKLAQLALESADLGGARRLLERHLPATDSRTAGEVPGWEWRYLWGLCRDEAESILVRQKDPFVGLRLSPDGTLLALRQPGGTIELWDWRARVRTGTLTNDGWERAFSFSPDGTRIASANRAADGQPVISIWDVGTRRVLQDIPQPSAVASMAFSPDGTLLATYHLDSEVRIGRLPSGECVRRFPGTPAFNTSLRVPLFSPSGTLLALGEMDGTLRLRRPTGEVTVEIPPPAEGNGVSALAFSPDGTVLAAGYGFSLGAILLWDTNTGEAAGRLVGHRSSISELIFAPDGRTLYSASADQTVRAWDVRERRLLRSWQGHVGAVHGLALSADGKYLMSCAKDGTVRLWNLGLPPRPTAYAALPIRVAPYGAPFTADSRRLITASATDPVTEWDVASACAVERIPALGTNLHSVALSPDDRRIAVGGLDGSLRIWDRHERRILRTWQAGSMAIYGLRFLDRGRSLVSLALIPGQRMELKRWEVDSWQESSFGPIDVAGCYGFTQSPDGRWLALSYLNRPPRVWDNAGGRLVHAFRAGGGFTPNFSPDGRRLVAAVDSRAVIWDVATGREFGVFQAPANQIVSVAFSPDGRRLVTGSSRGMDLHRAVHLWDPETGRDLLGLASAGAFTGWTEFSPDGDTVLALSWHGLAELWRAPSWRSIQERLRAEHPAMGPADSTASRR